MINIIPVLTPGKKVNTVKIGIVAVVLILVGLTYLNRDNVQNSIDLEPKIINISINNVIIKAEVVDTPELMAKGLGGRNKLDEGRGMWFVFKSDGKFGFWMKDMKFPIDIIWLDQNFKIVSLKKNILPESYSNIFYPEKNSRYVLEVNAGFGDKHKIKIGDKAEIISE